MTQRGSPGGADVGARKPLDKGSAQIRRACRLVTDAAVIVAAVPLALGLALWGLVVVFAEDVP